MLDFLDTMQSVLAPTFPPIPRPNPDDAAFQRIQTSLIGGGLTNLTGAHSTISPTAQALLHRWRSLALPAIELGVHPRIDSSYLFNRQRLRRRSLLRQRHFTRDNQESISRRQVFRDEDYETAESYFNSLVWEEIGEDQYISPHINILNIILESWVDSNKERFPTLQEIVERLVQDTSQYTEHLPLDTVVAMYTYYILTDGFLPRPEDYYFIVEYHLLHTSYPNPDQLEEMRIRAMRFALDPERFHAEDKMIVPTLHIERLPRTVCNATDQVCCICQDEIKVGQEMITLIPCGHVFHSTDVDCLENGSIMNWLSANNQCPMCKKKVEPK